MASVMALTHGRPVICILVTKTHRIESCVRDNSKNDFDTDLGFNNMNIISKSHFCKFHRKGSYFKFSKIKNKLYSITYTVQRVSKRNPKVRKFPIRIADLRAIEQAPPAILCLFETHWTLLIDLPYTWHKIILKSEECNYWCVQCNRPCCDSCLIDPTHHANHETIRLSETQERFETRTLINHD